MGELRVHSQESSGSGLRVAKAHDSGNDDIYTTAGFWRRYFAALIDTIVLMVIQFVPIFLVAGNKIVTDPKALEGDPTLGIIQTVGMIVGILYFTLSTKFYGKTLGKKALGIKVVKNERDGNLAWWQAIVRETVGKALSGMLFLIGYLMVPFNKRKRALHDFIGSTRVVLDDQ